MNKRAGIGFYIFLVIFVFLVMFPFIWVFLTSIKPVGEIFTSFKWFTTNPTVESYEAAVTNRPLMRYMLNSFIVSSVTTILAVGCAAFAAYAVTRLPIKGKGLFLGVVLAASMFPQVAVISPIFNIVTELGLRNSYTGLVIPYMTISLPLSIWILSTFFKRFHSNWRNLLNLMEPVHFKHSERLFYRLRHQVFLRLLFWYSLRRGMNIYLL